MTIILIGIGLSNMNYESVKSVMLWRGECLGGKGQLNAILVNADKALVDELWTHFRSREWDRFPSTELVRRSRQLNAVPRLEVAACSGSLGCTDAFFVVHNDVRHDTRVTA